MNALFKLQHSLYEYEVMTAKQLATVHSYRVSSIHRYLTTLSKQGSIHRVDVPAIGRGSKAYFLSPASAKVVAEYRHELNFFREKEWENVPGNLLSILIANQFFCELIQATRMIPDAGVSEWRGRRTLFQSYLANGSKQQPPKMNGAARFFYQGNAQHIYLNVLTGNESIHVIQEMLTSHWQKIQEENKDVSKALLLFVYLGKGVGKAVLRIWRSMLDARDEIPPYLAVASFEELVTEGIFASVWATTEQTERVSLLDMPGHKVKSLEDREFLGKERIIRLQFKPVVSGLSFFEGGEEEPEEEEPSEETKFVEETVENGIDWNV